MAIKASLTVILALTAVACNVLPEEVIPADHDYRLRYQSEVRPVMARVAVPFEQGQSLIPADVRGELDDYFAAYLRAGRGIIEMTVYQDGGTDTLLIDRASAIEARALAQGIRAPEFRVRIAEAAQGKVSLVELVFHSHVVSVPECGNWTRDNLNSFDNALTTNFGCATQANLGKMVADPGDLISRRKVQDPDTSSILRVLGRHQAGEPTSSADNSAGPEAAALGTTE
tara:strand:+ start:319 stop:1002 length:684 start_codon:yes stop_codon:yes gene_type:complete